MSITDVESKRAERLFAETKLLIKARPEAIAILQHV